MRFLLNESSKSNFTKNLFLHSRQGCPTISNWNEMKKNGRNLRSPENTKINGNEEKHEKVRKYS